jgi:hypothetical protein
MGGEPSDSKPVAVGESPEVIPLEPAGVFFTVTGMVRLQ